MPAAGCDASENHAGKRGRSQGRAAAPVTNYNFLSADSQWKLNLTENFIALSTLHYTGWEEFARHLDKPLAAFIKIYQPALFQAGGAAVCQHFHPLQAGPSGRQVGRAHLPRLCGAAL